MDKDNLPIWKKMALERGISLEVEEPVAKEKVMNGKEKKEADSDAPRRYTTIRIYNDCIPVMRQYAVFAGLKDAKNYAQILDALLKDRIGKYKEVLELLAKL